MPLRGLPTSWLVATFYSVLHGAGDDFDAGRLPEADASPIIAATLFAAFTAPGRPVLSPPTDG